MKGMTLAEVQGNPARPPDPLLYVATDLDGETYGYARQPIWRTPNWHPHESNGSVHYINQTFADLLGVPPGECRIFKLVEVIRQP